MKISWQQALQIETDVQKILTQQEITGVYFNEDKAISLIESIIQEQERIYNEIRPILKSEIIPKEIKKDGEYSYVKKPFKMNGEYTEQVFKWYYDTPEIVSGPFSRITYEEPELSKRQKLSKQLLLLGWKPELFTETGQPMLTIKGEPVESLNKIVGDTGKLLGRWFLLAHRRGQIQGWIGNLRKDKRITAAITGGVTNTYRRKHKIVCNVPKPKDSVVLGKEMRSLFVASPGKVLVGFDAKGLEARVEGHYTAVYDGGAYAKELLEGDIHTKNQEWISSIVPIDRDTSKNIKYGLTYGAQIPKIQKMLGCTKKQASEIFNGFWEVNEALGKLRKKVIQIGNKYGYLPGIDGRKIHLRGSEHAWLNALFQSCGAISMNYAMVFLHENCKNLGIYFDQVIYYHDEVNSEIDQTEVKTIDEIQLSEQTITDKSGKLYCRYGEQAVIAVRQAGKTLKLRCDLDSDYQIGNSWGDVH